MKNWEESLELATQNNNSQQLLDLAIKSQNGVAAIRKEFETSIDEKREALYDFQIKYLAKLNTLFGSNFHIKSGYGNNFGRKLQFFISFRPKILVRS